MADGMRIHIGGLMRCCTATAGRPENCDEIKPDGTKLDCAYGAASGMCEGMVAKGGIWWWSGIPENERTYEPLPETRKKGGKKR